MKVLMLATRDSSNISYANLYQALTARGHKCVIVVQDPYDKLNNKVFDINGIPYYPRDILTQAYLEEIDFAFVPPFGNAAFSKAQSILEKKKKMVLSFCVLAFSVSVRAKCDLVFTLNRSFFRDFAAYGMQPRMISIGDPRYDKLILRRKEREASGLQRPVKNILVIDSGAYPFGEKGQRQLADMLKNVARNNPELNFTIKLRFLPNEQGFRNHAGGTYLYDFLDDLPDNLSWIDHPAVLEDILDEYDASILLWSTAYYAVLAAGLPMLCVEGFDSDDVFDVRTHRVEDAYETLRASGCVRHYTELLNQPLVFPAMDASFARSQIENFDAPCSEQYVDCLERMYQLMIQEDLRFADTFQLSCSDFLRQLPQLPKYNKFSQENRRAQRYYVRLNNKLQASAYENRCLADAMDTSKAKEYYQYCRIVGEDEKKGDILLQELDNKLAKKKQKLFADTSSQDRIWWFYRFRYLSDTGDRKTLFADEDSPCPEGQIFFRGQYWFKRRQHVLALPYYIQYIGDYIAARKKGICDIPILRSLNLENNSGLQALVLQSLYRKKDYDAIEFLYRDEQAGLRDEIITYYMMLVSKARSQSLIKESVYQRYNMNRPVFGGKQGSRAGTLLLGIYEQRIDHFGKKG